MEEEEKRKGNLFDENGILRKKENVFIVEKKSYLRCVIGALRKVELLFVVE